MPLTHYCDRVSRRQALRLGSVGLIGGLTLPRLLELEAVASTGKAPKAKSVIFLFLEGGPSTIDMWDLKPDAPAEIRGPYQPIATNVPGTLVGEHCPLTAQICDKFTMLRSHSHKDNGHDTGYHYCMTGYKAAFADGQAGGTPNNLLFPSLGSIVSRELGPRGNIPCYINLPDPMSAGGPGFYGPEHAPFVLETDPVQPDFEVRDLRLAPGVNGDRFERRRRMLSALEKSEGSAAGTNRPAVMSTYYEKAYQMITAPDARKAFDITAESDKTRERYGNTSLGQCALLARRLVEAGSRFVGIDNGSWDTHFSQFPSLKEDLIPSADRAFSALVTDLEERGLLDSTLVIMMGEMGRTPMINNRAGRDHWSMTQTVLFAGGGVKPGQVIGATDKRCAYPTTDPYGVEDIICTLFHQLGVDTTKTYYTPLGRPVPICNGGKVIPGLV
ncbi:MAG: DUF1501 domain-containing protein [Planctomycetaceae bacterium]|nr:DUF1501 domain-containing protein [Planctomycetaceae bacterium]